MPPQRSNIRFNSRHERECRGALELERSASQILWGSIDETRLNSHFKILRHCRRVESSARKQTQATLHRQDLSRRRDYVTMDELERSLPRFIQAARWKNSIQATGRSTEGWSCGIFLNAGLGAPLSSQSLLMWGVVAKDDSRISFACLPLNIISVWGKARVS